MGKGLRSNVSLEDRVELKIHCTTLFCSLLRPTTHCIKKPHPPSPTSPTGALNDKELTSDHCQTVPGLWASLLSCLQGARSVGWGWGRGVGWGGENVSAWECGSGCMSVRLCCVCGKVSFKTWAVSRSSSAFALRTPPSGILPA